MVTFLFWNLKGLDISSDVAALVFDNQVDVLLLAENAIPPARLLHLLNPPGNVRFNYVPAPIQANTKIDIFLGFASEFLQPQRDTRRASIRKLKLPARLEILLCAVHFQSLAVWNEDDQAQESIKLNRIIREEEKTVGHSRTIVVGDLNMHPFSLGVTSASGFNAVMTREVALRGKRHFSEEDHPFFFNPMWNHFNDGESKPGGTFYQNPSQFPSIYWNMLDQVLIRPDLVPHFDLSSLKILTEHSAGKLIAENGRPSTSDHLPIIFRIKI
jgi:hypothetical protein